jgi:hypothetical protein
MDIMNICEQLPILLEAHIEGKEITLRLDRNGLGSFNFSKKNILELTFFDCELKEALVEKFQYLLMEVFEYEIFEENDKTTFQFWGDYGRIEGEFEHKKFVEKLTEYTKTDLVQKGKTLFKKYNDLESRFATNSSIQTQLRDKLKFEINNEIERFKRKAEFFMDRDKSKSEAFQSEIKVLQKLQKILIGNL